LSLSLFQAFSGVYLLDSTQIGLPDELAGVYPGCGGSGKAPKAGLKLQTLWDLTLGQIKQVAESAARCNDGNYRGYLAEIPTGSLLLFDLAYAGLGRLREIAGGNFYYICRFNPKCYLDEAENGKALALLEYLKKSEESEIEL
jgi:hypothetical protein